MKWVTREHVKVERVACPWLIRRFVDAEAEFLFVPADQVMAVAQREGAIPFDAPGVELGHHGDRCSFEAIVDKYALQDPAVQMMVRIVNGADAKQETYNMLEAPGLRAIAFGFVRLGLGDGHEIIDREAIVYDALYAYCQQA
ncbi:MAG: chromate resistance protein [Chloroflexota bacterium]|nr:chromate resistance protein [Chloroflexota bacterium]